MVGKTLDWRDELGRWLKPFWLAWATRRRDRCGRCSVVVWRCVCSCYGKFDPLVFSASFPFEELHKYFF
jgi:hypothetical protein